MRNNNPYADNFQSGGYFFNALNRDITAVRGDTVSFNFQVQGLEGELPEDAGDLVLTCKETPEDETALFEITLGNGILEQEYDTEDDVVTYSVRIAPGLTEDLDLGRYYYNLRLKIHGDVITLLRGRFELVYDIKEENV